MFISLFLLILPIQLDNSPQKELAYEVWDLVEIRNANGIKEYMPDNRIRLILFENKMFIKYFTSEFCSIGHFVDGGELGNLSTTTYLRRTSFKDCLTMVDKDVNLSSSEEAIVQTDYQVEYNSDHSEMILIDVDFNKRYKHVKGIMPEK